MIKKVFLKLIRLAVVLFGFCAVTVFGGPKEAEKAFQEGLYDKAYIEFLPSAEKGDACAQFRLYELLWNGKVPLFDRAKALEWLKKAAENNNSTAQYKLGECYKIGLGFVQNSERAVFWWRKAAELNNIDALMALGEVYEHAIGVQFELYEAMLLYKKAAQLGHRVAEFKLGDYYQRGIGVVADIDEAIRWFKKAAGKNDAAALRRLSAIYASKYGNTKEYSETLRLMEDLHQEPKLSRTDRNSLCYQLGIMYLNGEGVEKNVKKAVIYINEAAELGNREALGALGNLYETGEGVARNLKTAYECYSKIASDSDYIYYEEVNQSIERVRRKMKDAIKDDFSK